MLDVDKVAGACMAPMSTGVHFYTKIFLMPVTLSLFIFFVAAPLWQALRRQEKLAKLWRKLQAPQELTNVHMERTLLGMYLFVFTPLTRDAIAKLVCVPTSSETTENAPEVLSTDFSVSCSSGEFRAMAILSWLTIFTVLLAIPSFLVYKTKESRKRRDARLSMDVLRIDEMFKIVDEDKSGLLEENEIKLMLEYLKEPSGEVEVKKVLDEFESLPQTMFKKADEDGSGELSHDEIKQVCADMGRTLVKEELVEAFAEMDRDGSGDVSFEEFQEWFREDKKKQIQASAAEQGGGTVVDPGDITAITRGELHAWFRLRITGTIETPFDVLYGTTRPECYWWFIVVLWMKFTINALVRATTIIAMCLRVLHWHCLFSCLVLNHIALMLHGRCGACAAVVLVRVLQR
jgi:Ca2+-binding EF-hand superfamily protein